MKRLTLVRHGETYQNRQGIVQGLDPTGGRLTELGMRQARLVGEALAQEPFDVAYVSTLERAVLTLAQILMARDGERTTPIVFADALREINLSSLHGRPHAEWKAAIQGDPMTWKPDGGESWEDVRARVTRYWNEVIVPAEHEHVLIVAHGGANRGLIASLLGITIGQTWLGPGIGAPQGNTCVNRFAFDAGGKVVDAWVNDTRHLIGEGDTFGPGQRWIAAERKWEMLGSEKAKAEVNFYGMAG